MLAAPFLSPRNAAGIPSTRPRSNRDAFLFGSRFETQLIGEDLDRFPIQEADPALYPLMPRPQLISIDQDQGDH